MEKFERPFERPSDESRDSEGVDPEIKKTQSLLKSQYEARDKYLKLNAEYQALQASSSDSEAIGAKLGELTTAWNSYIQATDELDYYMNDRNSRAGW